MDKNRANERFLTLVAAIAASVFLFACGGTARDTGEPVAVATSPAPATASMVPPEPAPPLPTAPRSSPSGVGGEAPAGPVTFGTEEEPVTAGSAGEPASWPVMRPVEGKVFTNKDLDRYKRVKEEFGFKEGSVTVDLSQPAAQQVAKPAGNGESGKADLTDEEREKEARETRERINALSAEADYLRKRIPSLHNPLLPRAAPTEADKIAESGMDNVQRLEKVNARLAEVESELNGLQRRLAELHQKKPAGPDAPSP